MRGHEHGPRTAERTLTGWAWLSIAAAVSTIGLKGGAYLLTGSVGLLSDALESVVNLVAAILALMALRVAARPPDASHPFGHGKAEYLSAGAEGMMILVAAGVIVYSAISRLVAPEPLEDLGLGLAITAVATVINGLVGVLVLRAGRRHRSSALVADGHHLLTDVWTSIGVLVGLALVAFTGWLPLDSIVALAVAANIMWVGGRIVVSATHGLMDHALDADDVRLVTTCTDDVLAGHPEARIHGIQTRQSGQQRFVSLHVEVPGDWSVARGHAVLDEIEGALAGVLPGVVVHTHLEPLDSGH
jgi:cation diffusion facilitator family transporter